MASLCLLCASFSPSAIFTDEFFSRELGKEWKCVVPTKEEQEEPLEMMRKGKKEKKVAILL